MRYFPAASAACPTFYASEWHWLLDGAEYLTELSALLDAAGAGDRVWIAGFEFDPAIDLDGRPPDIPDHRPLGARLAELAAAGVDVRLVLASRVVAASVPGTLVGDFRGTAHHASELRELRAGGSAPLADRVLLDFGGILLGSNHQKFVVIEVAGRATAFVGGIDLVADRFDATPHDRLVLKGRRWGWHDTVVRLRGDVVERVFEVFRSRWHEATLLPKRWYLRHGYRPTVLNCAVVPLPATADSAEAATGTEGETGVRVLRSRSRWRLDSFLPSRRVPWSDGPPVIIGEVFDTLTHAFAAAQSYIYIEDQYLGESVGGNAAYELYLHLLAAARRGVKIVLVGSGTRDPGDTGIHLRPINRKLTSDVRHKLVDPLDAADRRNVAVYRVDGVTVHAKLVLVDDVFACIGSANMFSRSMAGTDSELSVAVETTTALVRELRVAVWADHLRTPMTDALRHSLADLDTALGIWRPEWAVGADRSAWRETGSPAGFVLTERVLELVGP